jgi:hypothetical protein
MDNRDPAVEKWFETYDNPQKALVQALSPGDLEHRPPDLGDHQVEGPTFMFRGNIASFYPRTTRHASLMFHAGAVLHDPTGLLEGDGETSRVARFLDETDLAAKTEALRGLIAAWIEMKS